MSKTISGIVWALLLVVSTIMCSGMVALIALQGDGVPDIPIRAILDGIAWIIFLLISLAVLKKLYLHIVNGIRNT